MNWSDKGLRRRVIADLEKFARQRGAFLLKLDPDLPVGIGEPGTESAQESLIGETLIAELKAGGWHFSDEQVQFRNTVLIDVTRSEEELLAAMKQKTRYNVRLAGRKGVTVRRGTEAGLQAPLPDVCRDRRTGWIYYSRGGVLSHRVADLFPPRNADPPDR